MLTNEQAENRKKFIGASELPAILGLSPWVTPSDVWLRHTGRIEESHENAHMRRGRHIEPAIIDWLSEELDKPIIRDTQFEHANGIMIASLDGLIELGNKDEVVEVKSPSSDEGWGEPFTDQIPDMYLVQTAGQFACLPEADLCHVAILVPAYRGLEFRRYIVRRNVELVKVVEDAAFNFMELIRKDTPPAEFRPSIEVAKAMKRTPGKTTIIPPIAITLYQQAQAKVKAAGEEKDRAYADLLAAMGDSEVGDAGEYQACLSTIEKKEYIVKAHSEKRLTIKKAKKN